MDYKQHKGNLRGQIKNKVERKLYNKRIRAEAIDVDTSEGQLTIPDVSNLVVKTCTLSFSGYMEPCIKNCDNCIYYE